METWPMITRFAPQGFVPPPAARASVFPAARGAPDVLRLIVLRQLEDGGPSTGADALRAVAALTCSLDLQTPVLSILHDLRDAGFLEATPGRPPRYAITEDGRREAERLAASCWPGIRDALVELNVCIGCLSPRDDAAAVPSDGRRGPALGS
jgi:DNA-binding PadR family transcriptional regulator